MPQPNLLKKKLTPKKSSIPTFKVVSGKFTLEKVQKLRRVFLDNALKNYPNLKIPKFDEAHLTFKDFKNACREIVRQSGISPRDAQISVEDSNTCCGVRELTFNDYYMDEDGDYFDPHHDDILDKRKKKTKKDQILKDIIIFLADQFTFDYGMRPYIKYYDNNKADKKISFLYQLKRLGWVCTGEFINLNHHHLNYELSAQYLHPTEDTTFMKKCG